jgi:hypothetical protein
VIKKMGEEKEEKNTLVKIGQWISYHDMANPLRVGVVVEIKQTKHRQYLLCGGGGKTMDPVTHEAVIIYPDTWYKSIIPVNMIQDNGHAGHQIVDRPFASIDDVIFLIEEYERMQPVLREEERLKQLEKQKEENKQKEQFLNDYPDLIPANKTKLSGAALGAKNIKKELSKKFPETKFSVTSEYYSMGCSIHVSWSNGPSRAEVEKITGKYQEGHFDGMEDLYKYKDQVWTDVFGGAKYVSESREITEDVMTGIAKQIAEYENKTFTDLNQTFNKENGFETWREIIWKLVQEKDLTHFQGIKQTGCSCGLYPAEFYTIVEA